MDIKKAKIITVDSEVISDGQFRFSEKELCIYCGYKCKRHAEHLRPMHKSCMLRNRNKKTKFGLRPSDSFGEIEHVITKLGKMGISFEKLVANSSF
jgi:hypothetical protein